MSIVKRPIWFLSFLLALFFSWGPTVLAQQVVGRVALGRNPAATAVDPALNKVYVVNSGSNSLTAVDEFPNTATTIAVGKNPSAVAVNPTTSRVYVANTADGTVTVIDGASNSVVSTVPVGRSPVALAVNTVTNKVYVANQDDNTVSIVDGATGSTAAVNVGSSPVAIAVNPADNYVYVANQKSNDVTVIGTDGSTATLAAGKSPTAIAVMPTTDVVYIVNSGDGTVTAANRLSGSVNTFSVGAVPSSIAINPVTNKIYVPSPEDGNVAVIDGTSGTTAMVSVGVSPKAIALDSISNKIFVANSQATGATALVSVIDGATNSVTEIAGSGNSASIALDPKSGRVYVPNIEDGQATIMEESSNSTTTIKVGTYPRAIAINPVTGDLFICNYGSGSVSIIDTASNAVTTVMTGTWPIALAVNPVTNTAYVVNELSATISVVDGNSKSVMQTIPIPFSNFSVATVDPVANKVYVALSDEDELAIVDGMTNSVSFLQVGDFPVSVAVNPVTNLIYVLNESSNSVSVIDGASMQIKTTIAVPVSAVLDVNPNTNKIYVAGEAGILTVIDGATNTTSSVQLASGPNYGSTLAINRQTNRIYVSGAESESSSTVVVIDGKNDTVLNTVTVSAPAGVFAINPLTDQIYSAIVAPKNNQTEVQSGVIDIDGATNTPGTISLPSDPASLVVDSVSGNVYATGTGDTAVTIITPNLLNPIPLTTVLSGVSDSQTVSTKNVFETKNPSPIFTAQVGSSYSPSASAGLAVSPAPSTVYYEVDGGANPWTRATLASTTSAGVATFNLCLSNIPAGLHTLYAFPSYGDESAESGPGNGTGNAAQIGNVTAVAFMIDPGGTAGTASTSACASTEPPPGPSTPTVTTLSASANPQTFGQSVTFTATVSPASVESATPTGTVTFFDGRAQLGSTLLNSSLIAAYTSSSLTVGSHSITAVYSGDSTYLGSTSAPLIETIVQPAPITTTTSVTTNANPQTVGASVTFTATVSAGASNSGSPSGTVTFYDAATELGTSVLTSSLTATFTTASLAQGNHPITGSYSGDATFAASTSSVLVESIVAFTSSGDFTIAASPSSLILTPGGSGAITLTLAPVNGFQGPVSLACGILPSDMSCEFQSQTVNLSGTAAQKASLTLHISQSALAQSQRAQSRAMKLRSWSALCFLPLLGLGGALIPWRGRRRGTAGRHWMMLAMLFASAMTLGGCGVTFNGFPHTYSVVVTASANSGALTHHAAVSVTIQP